MPRCRDMKRHEPGLRFATGFLIAILWLQASLPVTQATPTQMQPNGIQADGPKGVQPHKNIKHAWETVLLLTARGPDGRKVPSLHEDRLYIWWMYYTKGKFVMADNNTSLVVPKHGLYLLNLKMYYSIPLTHQCKQMLFLKTVIEQYHSSYAMWREVIRGGDTMQCVHDWQQSVTLTQVVTFEKGTKLRVNIDRNNYPFIVWDQSTYFTVTRL